MAETTQAQHSSLAARLNARIWVRLLGIFLCLDLLLLALGAGGLLYCAQRRCAGAAALVEASGLPGESAAQWLEDAGGCTVTALDRAPAGWDWSALPLPDAVRRGSHSISIERFPALLAFWRTGTGALRYTVELQSGDTSYAVTADLSAPARVLALAMELVLLCEVLWLFTSLFKNAAAIRRVLHPIQDLADAASRLGSSTSTEALQTMAQQLGCIDDAHLDARLPVDGTQRELKALSLSINAMLDRIDQAYRAQARFVSDASHELRTPIAVIQGYANLLNRWGKDDPAAMQEAIDAILQETQSMKDLVEQLLFLARGDNDSLAVEPELFDLTAVAGQVVRDSQVIDQTHPMDVRWNGPVYVNCDLGLVKQAVRILMDNAMKYTPAGGGIHVEVGQDGGYARLSVADEGIGISPEALPHIFDRFFRADESRTRQTGGSGLGLSIAKWIAERHDGWIEVTSRQNAGTRMTLVLPAVALPEGGDE